MLIEWNMYKFAKLLSKHCHCLKLLKSVYGEECLGRAWYSRHWTKLSSRYWPFLQITITINKEIEIHCSIAWLSNKATTLISGKTKRSYLCICSSCTLGPFRYYHKFVIVFHQCKAGDCFGICSNLCLGDTRLSNDNRPWKFVCSKLKNKLDGYQLDSCLARKQSQKGAQRYTVRSNLETVIMWQAVFNMLIQLELQLKKLPGLKRLRQELSGICALQLSIRIQSLLNGVAALTPARPGPAQHSKKTKVHALLLDTRKDFSCSTQCIACQISSGLGLGSCHDCCMRWFTCPTASFSDVCGRWCSCDCKSNAI